MMINESWSVFECIESTNSFSSIRFKQNLGKAYDRKYASGNFQYLLIGSILNFCAMGTLSRC